MPTKRTRDATRPSRPTKSPELSLAVQYATRSTRVPARSQLRRWVRLALERDALLTLRLVGAVEGRRLNRDYRGKDYATNVLTFVYERAPRLSGDIVLCAPVVAAEARTQGKPLTAHYAHLVVHGVLHLQGYDHEKAREARVMEARETEIVTRLGYADPYAPSA
jgi:probable rRNA maturation factor